MKQVFLAAALGMIVLGAAAEGKPVKVVEKLQVDTHGGKVVVKLTVENHGDAPVYVPKAVAEDGELFGHFFEVRDSSNGDPLDYTGPMVKRGPLGKDDFVEIKPHKRLRSTLDLSRAYAFLSGRHTYEVSYAGAVLSDPDRLATVAEVEGEPVMFNHTSK